jgi:ribosomal protein S18 acetylase RimI-like enzyme
MRLGVREKFRRQGVASMLLRRAISNAPEAMLTVRKGNDPAIRLYRKHDFVIAGTMPQDYAWVMRRFRKTSS